MTAKRRCKFNAAKEAFGCPYPNYDPLRLSPAGHAIIATLKMLAPPPPTLYAHKNLIKGYSFGMQTESRKEPE